MFTKEYLLQSQLLIIRRKRLHDLWIPVILFNLLCAPCAHVQSGHDTSPLEAKHELSNVNFPC